MIGNLFTGADCLLRGFRLINQPGVRLFALIPILVTLLVFVLFGGLAVVYFGWLLDWLLPAGDSWWIIGVRAILWPIFVVAVVLVWSFTFTVVANLIGAPFNGLLAEKVEARLTGKPFSDTGGLLGAIKDFVPSLINELRKFAYYMRWAIPLLVLFVVPVINVAAPFLWGIFMAWMLALEYVDYPMGNHGIRFNEVRRRLGQQRMLAIGFGGAATGFMLIPIVNLFVMPAAVAGGTALWVEKLKTSETSPDGDAN
jgi:CysZ protein